MAQARTTSRGSGDDANIGGGTRIRGRIAGDGDLTIEGEVEGEITLGGALTIAEGGKVTSEVVEAHSVTIGGTLDGSVNATGNVHALAGSRVRGNLRGNQVAIDDGAQFAGRLECEFDLPPELSETRSAR